MADAFDDLDPVTADPLDAAAADAEVKRLAGLDLRAYQSERKAAAKALGWQLTFLDAEVERLRPKDAGDGDDAPAPPVEALEPWPDPVDGCALAEEIRARLRAHVVFAAPADADAATLWIFGTYLMDVWRLWPRLMVTSPTKACGKTTLLETVEALCHRGMIVSNASPAVIYRAIEAWCPTLLLDEADTWTKDNAELNGILNSGHTKRTARVLRTVEVKGELLPAHFSTWAPMAIAGIGGQRDTLMSRSIVIGLRRRLPTETVERMPHDLFERMLRLRRQAARWADDHRVTLGATEAEPGECGDDRRRDNWTPLHRIAEALGGPWPERIAAAYLAQGQGDDDDAEPAGIMLLRDVLGIFAARGPAEIVKRLPTTEVVAALVEMEDRPWAEWRHGRPATVQTVARLLKPFSIRSKAKKEHGQFARVYDRAEVEAAAQRYLPQPPVQPATPQPSSVVNGLGCNSSRNRAAAVADENADNPLKNNGGCKVASGAEGWSTFYTGADPGAHHDDAPGYDPTTDPDTFNPDSW